MHPAPGDVVADRGYDAVAVLDLIAARDGRGHNPIQRDRKVQRKVDPALCRQRNLVERFFSKLKPFHKIAPRHEKTATTSVAAGLLVCSRLWTRAYGAAAQTAASSFSCAAIHIASARSIASITSAYFFCQTSRSPARASS